MTKKLNLAILTGLIPACLAFAQESPTPAPTETVSPSPTPSASATTRSVPLRFVPPPMEGTISLGIWDSNDKLVRVLHREAKIDIFTIDENALKTSWDGKNDAGEDLPAGKYRARGYLVGKLKIEDVGKETAPAGRAADHIAVKLVTNPLVSDTRVVMEIGVALDTKGCFLRTMDNLPLATINETPNLTRVVAIQKNGEKSADIWVANGTDSEQLRVSNIDKMMAFDCGFFDLK